MSTDRNLLVGILVLLSVARLPAQNADHWQKQLASKVPSERMLAVVKLGRLEDPAAVPSLVQALNDDDQSVRDAAVHALARIGPASFEPATENLQKAYKDAKLSTLYVLKKTAVKAAKGNLSAKCIEAVASQLKSEIVDVRILAAEILGLLGPKAAAAIPALLAVAADATPFDEKWMRPGASSTSEAVVPALLAIAPEKKQAFADEVVPKLIKELESGLEKRSNNQARCAVLSIGPFGEAAIIAEPAISAALKKMSLNHPERSVFESVRVKLQAGGEVAGRISIVRDSKSSPKEKADALRMMSYHRGLRLSPDLLGLLREVLKDKDVNIRVAAIGLTADLGAEAQALAPELIALLGDEEIAKSIEAEPGLRSLAEVSRILAKFDAVHVPDIAKVLSDNDASPRRRYEVLQILTMMGPKASAAKKLVKAAVGDRNPILALQAVKCYLLLDGDLNEVKQFIDASLKHEESVLRARGIYVINDPRIIAEYQPDILRMIDDRDPDVRIKAAYAVAMMNEQGKSAVPLLVARLEKGDERERYHMIKILGDLGPLSAEAVPLLIKQLDHLPNRGPNETLVALKKIGPAAKAAVPRLLAIAKFNDQPSDLHRHDALRALAAIRPDAKELLPDLLPMLTADRNRGGYTEREVLGILAAMGPKAKSAEPEVRKLLGHPEAMVRIWAHTALACFGVEPEKQVTEIIDLWKDDKASDNYYRALSMALPEALAALGPKALPAKELLMELLQDPKTPSGIRISVLKAICGLGLSEEVIVQQILPLFGRTNGEGKLYPNDFAEICKVLGGFGPKANEALPALEKLRLHGDPELEQAARKAIQKIKGK